MQKQTQKITYLIPARKGSKGIKNKNIIPFAGKPLIYWVLNAIERSNYSQNIVVATDSEQIKETVLNFNFPNVKVYDRNPQNARDNSPTIDLVLEYIQKLDDNELLCTVQCTSPLLDCTDVNGFISRFLESEFDSSFSCVEFPRICWTPDGKPICHDLKNRKRRQDMDKILVENGALYINSVKNIKENKSILSGNILPYIMPYDTITEIDEPQDIDKVERILKKRIKPNLNDYKLFLMDCDGVLTDGGMYYSENGEALKKFNTTDGAGIARIKQHGLIPAIITSENTKFAKERAKKLGIECFAGISDKPECIKSIVEKYNTDISKVIYIGDDINDLDAVKNVGFSACPDNAQEIIKQNVNYITRSKGGEGAVRELVNFLTDNIHGIMKT